MTVPLASTRAALADALAAIPDVQVYRHRLPGYQYPALIVGWPTSIDVRPAMGDVRDYVVNVYVGCEIVDPESSDDLLSDLLEQAVEALQAEPTWDVQPVTDFGEEQLADNRAVVWCRLPVAVFT